MRENTLPKAALGTALNYALKTREVVEACFHDGRYEIDNNLTENGIRVTKLGQKNWLFIGSAEAGLVAALVYTLVENCKRNGLDPYCYIEEVWTFVGPSAAAYQPSKARESERYELICGGSSPFVQSSGFWSRSQFRGSTS